MASQTDLESDYMKYYNPPSLSKRQPTLNNRKQWENNYFTYLADHLKLCIPGKKGLGFAVGREVLPSLLSNFGCHLHVTDMKNYDNITWAGDTTRSVKDVYHEGLAVGFSKFKDLVSFFNVDMLEIPSSLLREEYDFLWSICSIEHCKLRLFVSLS